MLLNFHRKIVPDFIFSERTGKKENAAFLCFGKHILLFDKAEFMTGQEAGFGNKVGFLDGFLAEAEMRNRDGSRLLGIVEEIALSVVIGIFPDNFDGVLIRADRPVGTKSVEKGFMSADFVELKVFIKIKRCVAYIIINTHGKVIPGSSGFQVVVNSFYHSRGKFSGTETIATAHTNGI